MNSSASFQFNGIGIEESCLSFESCGNQLHGILTKPQNEPIRGAFLFSHGWAGNRNGPANLLTWMARHLASLGYATYRFDFSGRGESDGNGLSSTLSTMADDLCNAASCLRKITFLESIGILGMCSGGNVAIGALPRLGKISSLLLLSVYPFSDGDSFGRDIHRAGHFLAVYLHKACCLENWKRLFCGEASLLRVAKVILRPFLKRGENVVKEGAICQKAGGTLVKASSNESRTSTKAAPQKFLHNLRKEIPCTMLYGTADPDAAAAKAYYGTYAQEHLLPIRIIDIQNANHNYSSAQWKQQLSNEITKSLGTN